MYLYRESISQLSIQISQQGIASVCKSCLHLFSPLVTLPWQSAVSNRVTLAGSMTQKLFIIPLLFTCVILAVLEPAGRGHRGQ